jgi:hypothetical protein
VTRLLTLSGRHSATGEFEDFMTGFVVSATKVWARPVGVAVANDGSLFMIVGTATARSGGSAVAKAETRRTSKGLSMLARCRPARRGLRVRHPREKTKRRSQGSGRELC